MKKIKKMIAVVALCAVAVQAASAVIPAVSADTGVTLQARSDIKTKPFGI